MDEEVINYMERYDDEKYMFGMTENRIIYVLEKTENTVLKEPENIANEEFAEYKASELKVVECFDVDDYKKKYYEDVGKMDIDVICYKRYECVMHNCIIPKTGKLYAWHVNGEVSKEANYVNGKLEGVVIKRYPDGNMYKRVEYKDNKRHGNMSLYYFNGSQSSTYSYKDGMKDGLVMSWDKKGNITCTGTYKSNLMHGKWMAYMEDDNVSIGTTYIDGKRNGKHFIWRNNVLIYECDYVNDIVHGICKTWYDNGNIMDIEEYANGKENGRSIHYNKHGKILSVHDYKDGEIYGKFTLWDDEEQDYFEYTPIEDKDKKIEPES